MAKVLSRKVTIYVNGKEVESTLKSLQAELSKLRNKQRTATIGSEEYIQTSLKMKEIESVLKEQSRAIQEAGQDWKDVRKAAADYADIIVGLKTLWQKGADVYGWAKGFSDEAARMDDVYADVMKTTGMTHDEALKLNEAFKQMDTRTAREELNKLAAEAGKLGRSGVQVVASFTEAADKIKVALGEDLGEDAITVIGKMADVYTRSTKQLSDAGDDLGAKMLRIGSAINSLGAASSAAEPHMVDFLSRLGGMASQAGLSAQQVLGYASALDQSGVSVEKSATAFQNFMARMMQKPAEFAAIARKGVDEFRQLMETDMDAVIKSVLAGLNQEGGMAQLVPIFKDLQLSGSGVTQMLTTLKGSIDKVNEAQAIANTQMSTGSSIEDEFATKNNTMQARLDKAKETFHDTAEALGNALYPAIIGVTNAGSELVKGLAWYIKLMTENKAVLVGTLAVMGNWLRIMLLKSNVVKLFTGGLKTMLGIEKLQGHHQDVLAAKTLKKTAAEEQERLATLKNELAQKKKIAAMKVQEGDYGNLTLKSMAQGEAQRLEVAVTNQATVATDAHTKSIQAQKAAFASTPWGLIITALTTIATIVVGIGRNSDRWKLKQTLNETARQAGEAEGQIRVLFNALEDATAGSESYKKAIDELKAAYPDLIAKHINEKGEIENLTAAYNELAAAARQSVYDRMYAEEMGKLQGELAQQLQKTLGGISNWVDTTMRKFTEAERTAVKQSMNTIARQFAEGTLTETQALDQMNAVMVKAKGLSSDAHVAYTGLLDGLDKKIKAVDRATNNLKTKLGANEADPFGVEKMNLEQLNAELTKSLNLQRSYQRAVDSGRDGYAERLDNETRKVEALRKQIAKLEAQKGNTDGGGGFGNYTTGETEKERKEREKREAREAKRIADAWEKAQKDAKKMTDKFNLQAESGLQKVKDDVDSKTEEMIARLRETAEEAEESADDLEKKLKEAAEKYKESQVAEYLNKVTAEVDKLKKATAKSEGGERLNKVSQAVENLRQQLKSVNELIEKLESDLGKADKGSDTYNQLQAEIERLKAIKKDAVSAAFSSFDFEVKNPFEEQSSFNLEDKRIRAIEEVKKKTKEYTTAIFDTIAAYNKMAETTRAAGNEDEARDYEAKAKALKEEGDNIDGISKKAEELARRNALKETINAWCDGIQKFTEQALSIFGNINLLLDNMADSELQKMEKQKDVAIRNIDEQLEHGVISQEQYEEQKKSIEEEYTKKENETKLEQWRRQKALDLTQAIIGGALAAVRAYAEGGPYAGPVLAAMIAAATGIQIAAIANQPEPYAKGGYVPKRTVYQAGEAGPEWVASNRLLNDPETAPIIKSLEAYQRGNCRALADIPMAQINMPVATRAAQELGRRRSIAESGIVSAVGSINPNVSVTMQQDGEMMELWRKLANYLKDPKNRQAVISRQTMTDFEGNENFLRNMARL